MENKGKDILDFSDLDEGIDFIYKGETFRIPAFTKRELDKLMALSKDFVSEKPKDVSEDGDVSEEEGDVEKSVKFFDMQDEYILVAVKKVSEDGAISTLTIERINEWPIKLKAKIMQLINSQMSITVAEVSSEGEKKS